jgi:hypothetical protein
LGFLQDVDMTLNNIMGMGKTIVRIENVPNYKNLGRDGKLYDTEKAELIAYELKDRIVPLDDYSIGHNGVFFKGIYVTGKGNYFRYTYRIKKYYHGFSNPEQLIECLGVEDAIEDYKRWERWGGDYHTERCVKCSHAMQFANELRKQQNKKERMFKEAEVG